MHARVRRHVPGRRAHIRAHVYACSTVPTSMRCRVSTLSSKHAFASSHAPTSHASTRVSALAHTQGTQTRVWSCYTQSYTHSTGRACSRARPPAHATARAY
eukprot:2993227-Pleurochrysis_carterae.AAC.1